MTSVMMASGLVGCKGRSVGDIPRTWRGSAAAPRLDQPRLDCGVPISGRASPMTIEDDDRAAGSRDDLGPDASTSLPPMTAMTPVDRAWAAPAPAQRFTPGEKIFGKYRVVRKLGQGGMGEVWLVRKEGLDCDRA